MVAHRPDQPLQLLQGDDQIVLDELLPGFNLTVQGLFETLAPDWLDALSSSFHISR